MSELQQALLPAAVGTVCIVYSSIMGMMAMGKVRYADDKFAHPCESRASQSELLSQPASQPASCR